MQVLYVGDHIYGDILRSKKELGKLLFCLRRPFGFDCRGFDIEVSFVTCDPRRHMNIISPHFRFGHNQ